MPKIDKYWVFHEGQLEAQLVAFFAMRVDQGVDEAIARMEVDIVKLFLTCPAGKPLQGGRAG